MQEQEMGGGKWKGGSHCETPVWDMLLSCVRTSWDVIIEVKIISVVVLFVFSW